MDIIDIVIQIQRYFPIFERYSLRSLSKIWKDAYYLTLSTDSSQFIKIFNWWKNNGAKSFHHRFDLSLKENVILGYSDSLLGEILYNSIDRSLHFISRVFKKCIFLIHWQIFDYNDIECFVVDIYDDKHVLYLGQTSKDEILNYIMISIDIRKFHKISNIRMKERSNFTKKFMFFRPNKIEYFIKTKTFRHIIPWESLYFRTNHCESENGNIFIRLTMSKFDKKIGICPEVQIISVNETKINEKDVVLLRFKMGNRFFTILVNESYVGFYPTAIFCPDKEHLIDSNGNLVETIEIIDKTSTHFTILDPELIHSLMK
jgi:hypothetical protein